MGAKGKYEKWIEPEGLRQLEEWAKTGLTDEQIAHNMGIAVSTYYEWKKKFVELSDAIKTGKEVIDQQVENALLKSALGFNFEEEVATPKGEVVKVQKYEKPNTTAQIFWLKNRKPVEWRDKQELKIEQTEEKDNELAVNQLKELRKKTGESSEDNQE